MWVCPCQVWECLYRVGQVWALSVRVVRATCRLLVKPAFMVVAWGERRCEWLSSCLGRELHCSWVIGGVVGHRSFQIDIDGFFDSSFKPSVFSDEVCVRSLACIPPNQPLTLTFHPSSTKRLVRLFKRCCWRTRATDQVFNSLGVRTVRLWKCGYLRLPIYSSRSQSAILVFIWSLFPVHLINISPIFTLTLDLFWILPAPQGKICQLSCSACSDLMPMRIKPWAVMLWAAKSWSNEQRDTKTLQCWWDLQSLR